MADQERVAGILERYRIPHKLRNRPDVLGLAEQAAAESALADVYMTIYPFMGDRDAQSVLALIGLCRAAALTYIDEMNELRIAYDAQVAAGSEGEQAPLALPDAL